MASTKKIGGWRGNCRPSSRIIRKSIDATLSAKAKKANEAKAKAAAHTAIVTEEAKHERVVGRAAQRLLERLRDAGSEGMAHSELYRTLVSASRPFFDDALAALLRGGQIRAEKVTYRNQTGFRYWITP